MGLIDNKWILVQGMAWRQAIIWTNGDQIANAYMHHSASMS